LSEFHAAIAHVQLGHLDEMNRCRRENAATLLGALGTVEGITPLPGLPETEPVHYNLILQYNAEKVGASRQAFVAALKAEGIPIHMFYVPLQRWPIFAQADYFGRGFPFSHPAPGADAMDYRATLTPVADAICDRANLEIKVQPTSGEKEMIQIAEAIRKILDRRHELSDLLLEGGRS
jgi:dTDP-4-amino-4,6-dideoxygalactose transaminase